MELRIYRVVHCFVSHPRKAEQGYCCCCLSCSSKGRERERDTLLNASEGMKRGNVPGLFTHQCPLCTDPHTQHVVLLLLTTNLLPVYGAFLFKPLQSTIALLYSTSLPWLYLFQPLLLLQSCNSLIISYAPIVWRCMKRFPVAWVFFHKLTSFAPPPLLLKL